MIGRRGMAGRGGRGVVRGVARTAVIAGTATATSYAVGSRIEKHREEKYQQEQTELAEQQYQNQPPQPPPQYQPAEPEPMEVQAGSDVTSQLQQLVELKQSGMLTDEEFSAAKARLLGA